MTLMLNTCNAKERPAAMRLNGSNSENNGTTWTFPGRSFKNRGRSSGLGSRWSRNPGPRTSGNKLPADKRSAARNKQTCLPCRNLFGLLEASHFGQHHWQPGLRPSELGTPTRNGVTLRVPQGFLRICAGRSEPVAEPLN